MTAPAEPSTGRAPLSGGDDWLSGVPRELIHGMNGREETDDLARRLRRLNDESEIRRLMARGQRIRDGFGDHSGHDCDRAACIAETELERGSPFSSDSVWQGVGLSPAFAGHRRVAGADRADFSARRAAWMPQMMHFLTNEEIEVSAPDSATGRWYSWEPSTAVVDGGTIPIWIAGRYHVFFKKVDDEWRIVEMRFEEIFSTPFAGEGWVSIPHVPYGPGQVSP